jgi:2-polyprenyl-3-methyl-5-hydroxy-6-metoxy-1,4-benzoquinol methylase
MPSEPFDLICCFEVMEHVTSPPETVATMVSLLKKPGVILFTTLMQPADMEVTGLNWWYASPRSKERIYLVVHRQFVCPAFQTAWNAGRLFF